MAGARVRRPDRAMAVDVLAARRSLVGGRWCSAIGDGRTERAAGDGGDHAARAQATLGTSDARRVGPGARAGGPLAVRPQLRTSDALPAHPPPPTRASRMAGSPGGGRHRDRRRRYFDRCRRRLRAPASGRRGRLATGEDRAACRGARRLLLARVDTATARGRRPRRWQPTGTTSRRRRGVHVHRRATGIDPCRPRRVGCGLAAVRSAAAVRASPRRRPRPSTTRSAPACGRARGRRSR